MSTLIVSCRLSDREMRGVAPVVAAIAEAQAKPAQHARMALVQEAWDSVRDTIWISVQPLLVHPPLEGLLAVSFTIKLAAFYLDGLQAALHQAELLGTRAITSLAPQRNRQALLSCLGRMQGWDQTSISQTPPRRNSFPVHSPLSR